MGFFRNIFGGYESEVDASGARFSPAAYSSTVQTGSPNVTTSTTLSAAERPAEAKQADTKEYEEGERRRKRKNGVNGSFGFTEKKNGVSVEKDAIGA